MCACENCLLGKFDLFDVQKGEFLQHYDNVDVDDVMEDEDEYVDEVEDEDYDEGALNEAMQARGNCIFDAVENETMIALFSSPSCYELFYLCKFLGMKITTKNM